MWEKRRPRGGDFLTHTVCRNTKFQSVSFSCWFLKTLRGCGELSSSSSSVHDWCRELQLITGHFDRHALSIHSHDRHRILLANLVTWDAAELLIGCFGNDRQMTGHRPPATGVQYDKRHKYRFWSEEWQNNCTKDTDHGGGCPLNTGRDCFPSCRKIGCFLWKWRHWLYTCTLTDNG